MGRESPAVGRPLPLPHYEVNMRRRRKLIENVERPHWNGIELFSMSKSTTRLRGESKSQFQARCEFHAYIASQSGAAQGPRPGSRAEVGGVTESTKLESLAPALDAALQNHANVASAHHDVGFSGFSVADATGQAVPSSGPISQNETSARSAVIPHTCNSSLLFDPESSQGVAGTGLGFSLPLGGEKTQTTLAQHPGGRTVDGGDLGTRIQNPLAKPTQPGYVRFADADSRAAQDPAAAPTAEPEPPADPRAAAGFPAPNASSLEPAVVAGLPAPAGHGGLLAEQARLVAAVAQAVLPLASQLQWAQETLPDLLHRIAVLERALATASPPHKPWLPPIPPHVEDRILSAQRFRESLDPNVVRRIDSQEAAWPYCAWHLIHARMVGNHEPVSLSLEPRDKLALDRAWQCALECAYYCEDRAADLLYHWIERFFSLSADDMDGATVVDKFYRLLDYMPRQLPSSLCDEWPLTPRDALEPYSPRWPMQEIEFQWVQLRNHHYEQRAAALRASEQERLRVVAEAEAHRAQREQELREQHALDKAAVEAALAKVAE